MKNILVTGGNGQLGRSLQKIAGDYPAYRFVFADLPATDITDAESVERIIVSANIDIIVNCAAYTQVDRAESEPELAAKVNIDGTRIMAETAAKHGLRLVHISTDYVYGGSVGRPLREDDATAPENVYGATKLAGEEAVKASGGNSAVIRTSWLYSEFGTNFVRTMLRLARERGTVSVINDQWGTPTYATDLGRAIMSLVQQGIEGFELYNYSDQGEITWYDFASEIFRQAGVSVNLQAIPTSAYPTPAKRPAYSVLDKTKIKSRGIAIPLWRGSLAQCLATLKEQEEKE